MMRKLIVAAGLVLPALIFQTVTAAEPLPPACQWIPQDALVTLEMSHPKALLDLVLDPKRAAAVTSLPIYRQAASQPGFRQFLAVVSLLEARLGTDWKTAVRKLVGGGITFAARADESVLLIVEAEDGELLRKLHDIVLEFAKGQATQQGNPDGVAFREYEGVPVWTFGGDEAHAIVGNRLLLSNKPEALKAMLDLRAEGKAKSLASVANYQAARKAVSTQAPGVQNVATAFVNIGVLKQAPEVRQALEATPNPLVALLLAGVTESLRSSNWLALGLSVGDNKLALEAIVDGKATDPAGPASFALPGKAAKGALPNLSVPRRIAALSFYRDLHGFYAAKDDLFPERTSGLIFFENMMGIFFSGLDLTEEVLAEMQPEFRIVVAEQVYDPAAGVPELQIPAFAAVFRLREPEEFGEVVEEAWQKVIGLVNFTRGQQAQPGLIIDRPTHADTKFTVAYFRTPKEDKTDIDSRFNFRPALVRMGENLILSSTDALAKDLIDALHKEATALSVAVAETHSLVDFDAVQLASILGANRDNLVRNNMLEDGSTKQEAEAQIDLILTIVKYLGQAKLELGSQDGRPRVRLELSTNLP